MNQEEKLKEKVNQLLERTVKTQEHYKKERKFIFNLLQNIKDQRDEQILEQILDMFQTIIQLEEEKRDYHTILEQFQSIKEQQIRKQDEKIDDMQGLNLFLITDKEGKKYTFFLRENAKKYLKENNNKFEKETKIEIIKNNNIDLEKILKI